MLHDDKDMWMSENDIEVRNVAQPQKTRYEITVNPGAERS